MLIQADFTDFHNHRVATFFCTFKLRCLNIDLEHEFTNDCMFFYGGLRVTSSLFVYKKSTLMMEVLRANSETWVNNYKNDLK